jgi:hypothetical protein
MDIPTKETLLSHQFYWRHQYLTRLEIGASLTMLMDVNWQLEKLYGIKDDPNYYSNLKMQREKLFSNKAVTSIRFLNRESTKPTENQTQSSPSTMPKNKVGANYPY